MANNPFWQGGMGLSIGYHAWNGTIDLSTEPPEHREFYAKATLVTKENAQEVLDTIAVGNLSLDWNDLWGLVDKGIEAAATPTS
jgi:ribose transport system substrate-binding protein